tara:strand:+ start:14 stop:472 length:459 start_codon:yes stop_codon:yes gene_type:complete
MSTLFVDTINEKTSGNGVNIPGHVLQVKEAEYSTQTDISSTSYADLGLSVSITPTSSSSKILVITNVHSYVNGTGLIGVNVVRDSTQIVEASKALGFADNSSTVTALTKLDSPGTTSATTYKIQVKKTAATGTMRINQQDGGSRITVMEIGA